MPAKQAREDIETRNAFMVALARATQNRDAAKYDAWATCQRRLAGVDDETGFEGMTTRALINADYEIESVKADARYWRACKRATENKRDSLRELKASPLRALSRSPRKPVPFPLLKPKPRSFFNSKDDVAVVSRLNSCLNLDNLDERWTEDEHDRFIEMLEEGRVHFSGDMTGFHLRDSSGEDFQVDDCAADFIP